MLGAERNCYLVRQQGGCSRSLGDLEQRPSKISFLKFLEIVYYSGMMLLSCLRKKFHSPLFTDLNQIGMGI